jgi:hypothetical protein
MIARRVIRFVTYTPTGRRWLGAVLSVISLVALVLLADATPLLSGLVVISLQIEALLCFESATRIERQRHELAVMVSEWEEEPDQGVEP